jgi:Rne/Rng family ribonuclease
VTTQNGPKSRPRRSRRGKKNTDETANADTEETATVEAVHWRSCGLARQMPHLVPRPVAPKRRMPQILPQTASDGSGESDGEQNSNDKDDGKPTEMAADVETEEVSEPAPRRRRKGRNDDDGQSSDDNGSSDDDDVESVGSEDAQEELPARPQRKPRKQYRIQEVIKRRQILLVQVVKEERGNKGAALTTYLSLAGRYSVLMPNTARGGGISRKITNLPDRKRLKEIARELEVPQGMGVILRTAGANRTKVEVKRDFEYLMRLWENVRNLTLQSTAPSLVYEEGSLIKRSIRDLYNKDISEIVVSGEEGYREAKDFMKMLMPSHAKVVQPYRDLHPIFARSGIEAQLDRMLQPQVTLKSGGYIIINQTEALVAIDVNSGRSTREHSIEDTALQTNLEAADEVARQLRLRDLAGLIVIDFIDMEENRNNRAVEKRMKDCLKNDRARIQVGRISHFGLLEMSRQRIRASVLESTMQICPTCGGNGHIRSQSSVALHVLRGVEEYLLKNTTHDIIVRTTVTPRSTCSITSATRLSILKAGLVSRSASRPTKPLAPTISPLIVVLRSKSRSISTTLPSALRPTLKMMTTWTLSRKSKTKPARPKKHRKPEAMTGVTGRTARARSGAGAAVAVVASPMEITARATTSQPRLLMAPSRTRPARRALRTAKPPKPLLTAMATNSAAASAAAGANAVAGATARKMVTVRQKPLTKPRLPTRQRRHPTPRPIRTKRAPTPPRPKP